jgi:solute carrier family 39 (zinc transporter), member 9
VGVLLLSFAMFIASFSAGTIPLVMSLSHDRMNLVSSLGIGLLVGTSLGVVLPEGIEMLYGSDSARTHTHHRLRRAEAAMPDAVHRAIDHNPNQAHQTAMALALVSGYLIMHLLTFLPPLLLSRKSNSAVPMTPIPSSPRLERINSPNPALIDTPKGLSNTTIGLCIHALADGIALGSSAASNNIAIQGIVFFAIMLHKVRQPWID